jgi:hypothetical protein
LLGEDAEYVRVTKQQTIMPTRILREGILTSETVNRLSIGAELFYRKLMSVVDDYGRYHAHLKLLHANVCIHRWHQVSQEDVAAYLKECVDLGLIELYNDNKTLEIKKFDQRRRSPSKFPKPPEREPAPKCPSNDGQLPALGEHQAEAETESKAKADAGGTPQASPPGVGTHTPSWPDVLAYAQQIGCPEAHAQNFFDHFNGLRDGWEKINWKNRLKSWWRQDQAEAAKRQAKEAKRQAKKPSKPKERWPLEDFM